MSLYPQDKPAAFVGLIGGFVLVLVMVIAIVAWTNTKFEGHGPAATAPAGQTSH